MIQSRQVVVELKNIISMFLTKSRLKEKQHCSHTWQVLPVLCVCINQTFSFLIPDFFRRPGGHFRGRTDLLALLFIYYIFPSNKTSCEQVL